MNSGKIFATGLLGMLAGSLSLSLSACSGQSSNGSGPSDGGYLSVGGSSQQAGATSAGGAVATGGRSDGAGGQNNETGGSAVVVGTGGTSAVVPTGGAPATGGSGGNPATGGRLTTGGTATTGGSAKGGTTATGGTIAGTGGATSTGGASAAKGGATGTGGTIAGTGGTSKGGATGTGGTSAGGTSGGTSKITVWLAGDSTMATGSSPCPVGWGAKFQAYFNSNATVVNDAVGGTTVRSWLYNVTSTMGADGDCTLSSTEPQAHWTAMVNGMKAGDYLLIQFGINDTTSATCPKHVSIAMYEQLFGMMAQAAQAVGANPIFLTAVSSISCNGTVAQPTRGTFAAATKAAATQYNVPLIDL